MKLKDLIRTHSWLSIEFIILRIYPLEEKNMYYFEELFFKLQELEATQSKMSLSISFIQDTLDKDRFIVRISGKVHYEDYLPRDYYYSLHQAAYDEWLGMEIDPDTMLDFTELEIVAYCIVEMATRGYREDVRYRMRKLAQETLKKIDEIAQKKRLPKFFYARDNDGNRYKTIRTGNQRWMTRNLNSRYFRNGDLIMEARTDEEWNEAGQKGIPAWCYYYNNPGLANKFGKLYNWFAVNDPRGLAPVGWHIPNNNDWQALLNMSGGSITGGAQMKSKTGWAGLNGSNSTGFNGLPGGFRGGNGFRQKGQIGFWWSSSEINDSFASNILLKNNTEAIVVLFGHKHWGYSVRCLTTFY
jgi:uncharacterized protein (TIGR02145 family)